MLYVALHNSVLRNIVSYAFFFETVICKLFIFSMLRDFLAIRNTWPFFRGSGASRRLRKNLTERDKMARLCGENSRSEKPQRIFQTILHCCRDKAGHYPGPRMPSRSLPSRHEAIALASGNINGLSLVLVSESYRPAG